jgi:diguanylate cyclase (GGDEF)-like protein
MATPHVPGVPERPATAGRAPRADRRADRPSWLVMALAMGVLLALYACWHLLGRPGGDGSLVGDLFSLPFDAAAVFGAWIAMRRCARGSRTRTGWLLLCLALACNLAGDVTWMLYEAVGQSPYPSAADALYLASYPLMLFGLLRFALVRLHGAAFARVALDLAVVAIGASAVVLYVVLGPTVVEGSQNALQTAISAAYPVGDMVLLAGLASLATRRSPRSATRALQFVGAGLLCWVAGDLIYGYITLHGTYRGGDPVDSLWLVATALFAIAGTAQLSLASDEGPDVRPPPRTSRAPYLAVLVGFGLLIASQVHQSVFPDMSMALTAAALAVLVSIRQFLAQRDLVRSQRQLSHQSLHDALTDLPNRALVIDRAGHMLARAQRAHVPAAALYVDIDGFKRINDSYGHAVGDELLGIVADRLREIVRDSDTAGRMGGDEFVVLIEGPALDGEVRLVAERLLDAIRRPIELSTTRGRPVSITASIGIARAVAGSADDLLRDADFALYDAKAKGRNRYAIFESRMQMVIGDQLELELDLGDALARDEFFVL